VEPREKIVNWKAGMEVQGLRINTGKTTAMNHPQRLLIAEGIFVTRQVPYLSVTARMCN